MEVSEFDRVLSNIMSPLTFSWNRIALLKSASRNPNCTNIKNTAKPMPAIAISNRTFSRLSCSQANGITNMIDLGLEQDVKC